MDSLESWDVQDSKSVGCFREIRSWNRVFYDLVWTSLCTNESLKGQKKRRAYARAWKSATADLEHDDLNRQVFRRSAYTCNCLSNYQTYDWLVVVPVVHSLRWGEPGTVRRSRLWTTVTFDGSQWKQELGVNLVMHVTSWPFCLSSTTCVSRCSKLQSPLWLSRASQYSTPSYR